VQEKLKWLRRIVENVEKYLPAQDEDDHSFPPRKRWKNLQKSIRVTGFFGGSRTTATWADTDIAVCTIEKANSLINSAIEECSIGDLGVVVLDELHMLDDEHRGYLLELMVTKLLLLQQDIQIVGMSATLSVRLRCLRVFMLTFFSRILRCWHNGSMPSFTSRPIGRFQSTNIWSMKMPFIQLRHLDSYSRQHRN
jgi:hypothetical protein